MNWVFDVIDDGSNFSSNPSSTSATGIFSEVTVSSLTQATTPPTTISNLNAPALVGLYDHSRSD